MNTKWILLDAVLGGILKQVALLAIAFWGLPVFDYYLPLWAVVLIGLALAVQSGFSCFLALRLRKLKPVTGTQTMIGRCCVTATVLDPEGYVRIDGELWRAVSVGGVIGAGMTVLIVAVDGMALKVKGGPSG
ncbi:MAG: NfeD family protein [Chloroflexota bacterium]